MVARSGSSLFGLNWLDKIVLDWGSIKSIRLELDQLLLKHEAVFHRELGMMQRVQTHLEVDPTAQQKFHKPCSVPYARAIEHDLERLERISV